MPFPEIAGDLPDNLHGWMCSQPPGLLPVMAKVEGYMRHQVGSPLVILVHQRNRIEQGLRVLGQEVQEVLCSTPVVPAVLLLATPLGFGASLLTVHDPILFDGCDVG